MILRMIKELSYPSFLWNTVKDWRRLVEKQAAKVLLHPGYMAPDESDLLRKLVESGPGHPEATWVGQLLTNVSMRTDVLF